MIDTFDTHSPLNPSNQPNKEWDLDSAMEHAEKNILSDAYEVIENELISRNMKLVLSNQKIRDVKTLVKKIEVLEAELSHFGSLNQDDRLELDRLKKDLYTMFK